MSDLRCRVIVYYADRKQKLTLPHSKGACGDLRDFYIPRLSTFHESVVQDYINGITIEKRKLPLPHSKNRP